MIGAPGRARRSSAVVAAARSSRGTPFSPARTRAVSTTKAGSFRFLVPEGDRGEERGVRLDEEPVQRGPCRATSLRSPGLGEGQDAGERDQEAQVDHRRAISQSSVKQWRIPPAREARFPDRGDDLGARQPAVDDDREAELPGQPELVPEGASSARPGVEKS